MSVGHVLLPPAGGPKGMVLGMLSRNGGPLHCRAGINRNTLLWVTSWLPPPNQAIQHSNSLPTNVCDVMRSSRGHCRIVPP